MTSLYERVESAIVERLAEFLQSVKVEGFPDDGNELGKAVPVRRVLVGYQSSSFEVLSETPQLIVKETQTFEVTIGVKGLRSHTGVYNILQEVRRALMGFLPVQANNARRMRPTNFLYKGIEDGIWYYSASFSFELTYGEYDVTLPDSELPVQIEPLILPNQITLATGIWRSLADALVNDSVLDTEYTLTIPPENEQW